MITFMYSNLSAPKREEIGSLREFTPREIPPKPPLSPEFWYSSFQWEMGRDAFLVLGYFQFSSHQKSPYAERCKNGTDKYSEHFQPSTVSLAPSLVLAMLLTLDWYCKTQRVGMSTRYSSTHIYFKITPPHQNI